MFETNKSQISEFDNFLTKNLFQAYQYQSIKEKGCYPNVVATALMLTKMLLHLVLQTSFSYVLLHVMIQNERLEYFRSFLEESIGLNYVHLLYGAVLSLCFPVLLFLQNFLAAYVLNCFPDFKNSLTFMRNIYVDFYKKLDTNLTRSNSISIFNKASTIWLICSAYFAYTLPMILVFIFILFFDPKTSLCWSYRSTFLLNNERKG